jgi:hypothetical protein
MASLSRLWAVRDWGWKERDRERERDREDEVLQRQSYREFVCERY